MTTQRSKNQARRACACVYDLRYEHIMGGSVVSEGQCEALGSEKASSRDPAAMLKRFGHLSQVPAMNSFGKASDFRPAKNVRPALAWAALVAGCFGILCSSGDAKESSTAHPVARQKDVKDVGKARPWITVAKDTTYVTEPVAKDGYVDYLAALNAADSEGATVDNNAAIWLVRAMDLSMFKEADRKRFFAMLGIEPSPVAGVSINEFPAVGNRADGGFADPTATTFPWSTRDFPALAKWLTEKEKPLQLAIDATRRSHCYVPLVRTTDDEMLFELPLPVFQTSTVIARALVARAMLRLNEGKVSQARQDLLACHRLGRLLGRTPLLMAGYVAAAIDDKASIADAALLEYGQLTAAEALAYRAELLNLPPLPSTAYDLEHGERLLFLGAITEMERNDQTKYEKLLGPPGTPGFEALTDRVRISWNEAMRTANREWDRWGAAWRQPLASGRQKQLEILETEFRPLLKVQPGEAFKAKSPREAGKALGRALVARLLPAVDKSALAEDRARVRGDLVQLGFALAAYRVGFGEYPATLDALVPKYCSEVPPDRFSGKPLHYVRQADGFLLYSVGKNAKDDGGRGGNFQPPGDDIVLRIPGEPPLVPSRPKESVPQGSATEPPSASYRNNASSMKLAAVLFAVGAIGGLTMAGIRLAGKPRPPTWLALGHGAIGAGGLIVLIGAAATGGVPALGLLSLGEFVVAALGGSAIFVAFHLKQKPLPLPLVLGHGAIALTAFAFLLLTIYR